jgi:ubiquinone biosynthesis accessory factor UbiJ
MLTDLIANLLNRGLPRSPRARELCAQLKGKSLAIEIGEMARFHVASNGTTLEVTRGDTPADATLAGGPLSLLALAGAAPESVVQRGAVTISGDAQLAQQFRELAKLLRPDLEEDLSSVLGDVPAHQVGRLARLGAGWTRKAATTTLTNLAEYLGHERQDLVPRNEGEQFLRGVDSVREDVERLEARLEILARRPVTLTRTP